MPKFPIILWLIALLTLNLMPRTVGAKSYPQYQIDGQGLTPQEEWVLEQAEKGGTADLLELCRAEDFFRDSTPPVDGKLGLPQLLQKLDPATREAFLVKFGEKLELRPEFLARLLTNRFPNLKVHYHGISIRNAIIKGTLDIRSAEIPYDVKFQYCKFQKINFWDSHFKKNLNITYSTIDEKATFRGMKVDKNAHFKESIFMGEEVSFNLVKIFEESSFEGVHFDNIKKGIHFDGLEVGKNFYFNKVKAGGNLNFRMAKIGGILDMNGTEFYQDAFFDSLKCDYSIKFRDAQFKGKAHFPIIKVGNFADFRKAKFHNEAWFGGAEIQKDLRLQGAEFRGADEWASNFFGLKVGHRAFLNSAVFSGPATFQGATIGIEFDAGGAQFLLSGDPPRLEEAGAERPCLNARGLQVGNLATFRNTVFKSLVDFSGARFATLDFSGVAWPPRGRDFVLLSGMVYQSINLGAQPGKGTSSPWFAWSADDRALLTWLGNTRYDANNYRQLQAYLTRTGREDLADQVYINMKRRENHLENWGDWLKPWKWPLLLLWDLPVGYGRQPLKIFWFALAFVLMGAVVYHPRYLSEFTWPFRRRFSEYFLRILLSIDKFTPALVDLGLESKWQLAPDRGEAHKTYMGRKIYDYLHRRVGRIFAAVFFIGVWEFFKN